MEVDVLIVGAGPAGSTTARYCAGKDLDVLMIDRRKEVGHPVQCGEFLPSTEEMYTMFPKSVDLEELFAPATDHVAGEVHRIDLVSPKQRVYGCDFEGVTLDRRAFDKHLARLATDAGARLETSASFRRLENGVARTSLGDIKAKVIVGADGPNSRTAAYAGLERPLMRFPAVTCQADGDFGETIKMLFGSVAPGGYAWIIPKRKGANIGVGVNPMVTDARPSDLFARFASRLGASYRDVTMGFVPMSGPVDETVRGNVVLVGDAAGQVMSSNGGGIPISMVAGRIAGRAIREHINGGLPLSEYERRWRAVLGKPLGNARWTRTLSDLFLSGDSGAEFAMRVLGSRGLARAIRCSKVFYVF